ncbi:NYN domain-containing protein [Aestuariibacter sp. A3R04]|uniref:LabA-like NYN domain-containing protein n=1 Tax=Aestuariibacter sp. A3R04 TaxID=2841571 RepID=UPI001C0911C8|nr:NYN domain-containing protein [Aestuariibacter sp. A3R04]MBU3020700.1 NYN domain-containing protein [Aestuariibacter sp. A3R04]
MEHSPASAAVFVDVQNIYYTCRDAFSRQFNYRKLVQYLNETYSLKHAFAYATESNSDGQHKFQKALTCMGFEVKTKPYIQRQDGSAKGDWDVGITIDVMEYGPQVEHVYLLSGDGDFDILLAHLKRHSHVQTHVFSAPSLTAASLIRQASHFHPINASWLL